MALTDKLSAIGDAIRAQTGKEEKLTLDQMPDEIAGISGASAPVLAPLTVTENGTYYPTYEAATVTWDETTEYDGVLSVDGIPLRYKKVANLTVPDDVSELENPEYCFAVTFPDGTVQSTPLSELRLGSADGIYLANDIGFAVVWVKDATYVNAGYGASLEDNTVYVTDYLWLAYGDEFSGASLSLTAPGKKLDGFSSVTVEVSREAIVGAWKINSCGNHFFTEYVNFTALYNGDTRSFQGMRHSEDAASDYLEYLDEGNWVGVYSAVNGWVDGTDIVDFGDEPQMVSPAFKEWLTANATRQESGTGGGLAINGIIEQYRVNAGATVNAGDFVEFVNKCAAGEFRTASTGYLSACKLDNSRVLVAYQDYSGSSTKGKAVVLTINNGMVSVGKEIDFGSYYGTTHISVSALTANKAVVSYRGYTGSKYEGYAKVLSVDGDTITAGSEVKISDSTTNEIASLALSENNVLFAYRYKLSSEISYVDFYKVGTASLTKQSGVQLGASNDVHSGFSFTKLNESKAILKSLYSSNYRLSIISVNETTVSAGSTTSVADCRVTAFSDTLAVAVFNDTSKSSYFSAMPLNINGSSITKGTPVVLRHASLSVNGIAALSENKVLVTFTNGAMVITVDGVNISVGVDVKISDDASIGYGNIFPFSVASAFVVFVGSGFGKYASLTIDGDTITVADASGTFIQPATGRLHNVGVAATGGASGETVDVYVVG